MIVAKKEVLNVVKKLPQKVELDDLMYRFYLLEKIHAGEADFHHGKTLSHEQAKKQILKHIGKE